MRGRDAWIRVTCAAAMCVATGCSGGTKSEVKEAERELTESLPERTPYVAELSEPDCIRWKGYKETGAHLGGFEKCTGYMSFDSEDVLNAVEVEVDITSIIADNEMLRGHLLSADFFDMERFPKATFKSMAVRPLGKTEDGMSYEIEGAMTIRGVTQRITVEAVVARVGNDWEGEAQFELPRFDYGMTYIGKANDAIHNEANVVVSLKAPYDPRAIVAEEVGR